MNELKAISQTDTELRVGNYMVLFGGRDLTGEFFTKSTDFRSNYTDLGVLYVDFEHGRDAEKAGNSQDNVLGIVDWKSSKVDETGIFVERVLNRRAKYIEFLRQLIEAGVMGTSSEAIPGATRRKSGGEIVEWPLMRDSLTVTPIDLRMMTGNVISAAKALADIFPNSKSLALITGDGAEKPSGRIKIIETIASLGDAEDCLRDAGWSRKEAKALLSRVKGLPQRDADEGEIQRAAEALKRTAAMLYPSI
jgi:hypothetical protein